MKNSSALAFDIIKVYSDIMTKSDNNLNYSEKERFKAILWPNQKFEIYREYHYLSNLGGKRSYIDCFSTIKGNYTIKENTEEITRIQLNAKSEKFDIKQNSQDNRGNYRNKKENYIFELINEKLLGNKVTFTDRFCLFKYISYEVLYQLQIKAFEILGKKDRLEIIKELAECQGNMNDYFKDNYPDFIFEKIDIQTESYYYRYGEDFLKACLIAANGNRYLAYELIDPKYKAFRQGLKNSLRSEKEAFEYYHNNQLEQMDEPDLCQFFHVNVKYKKELDRLREYKGYFDSFLITNIEQKLFLEFINNYKIVQLAILSITNNYEEAFKDEIRQLESAGYTNQRINLNAVKYYRSMINTELSENFKINFDDILAYVNLETLNWNNIRVLKEKFFSITNEAYIKFLAADQNIYLLVLRNKAPKLEKLLKNYENDHCMLLNIIEKFNFTEDQQIQNRLRDTKQIRIMSNFPKLSDLDILRTMALKSFHDERYCDYQTLANKYKEENMDLISIGLTNQYENLASLYESGGNIIEALRILKVPRIIIETIKRIKIKAFIHKQSLGPEYIEHELALSLKTNNYSSNYVSVNTETKLYEDFEANNINYDNGNDNANNIEPHLNFNFNVDTFESGDPRQDSVQSENERNNKLQNEDPDSQLGSTSLNNEPVDNFKSFFAGNNFPQQFINQSSQQKIFSIDNASYNQINNNDLLYNMYKNNFFNPLAGNIHINPLLNTQFNIAFENYSKNLSTSNNPLNNQINVNSSKHADFADKSTGKSTPLNSQQIDQANSKTNKKSKLK